MRRIKKRTSGMLLVELMIVIFFFTLSATVLIEGFFGAYRLSNEAQTATEVLNEAQNLADSLYAAEDARAEALLLGFQSDEEGLYLEQDGILYRVYLWQEGSLRGCRLEAWTEDELLLTLPCSRYMEVSP